MHGNKIKYQGDARIVPTFHLDKRMAAKLARYIRPRLQRRGPLTATVDWISAGDEVRDLTARYLPDLLSVARSVQERGGPDAVCIAGLPRGPNDAREALQLARVLNVAIARAIGEPLQYRQQNRGQLSAVLSPSPKLRLTQSGQGAVQFGWHSDDAILEPSYRTQLILLAGVVNENRTITGFAAIDNIVERLTGPMVETLLEERYRFLCPTSFGIEGLSPPRAILYRDSWERLNVNLPTYNWCTADPGDSEAQRAATSLIAAIDACATSVVLDPATAFLFNNARGLHSRAEIKGRRTVVRTYVRADLDALRCATGHKGWVFDLDELRAAGALALEPKDGAP